MLEIAICDGNRNDLEQIERALDKLSRYFIDYDVYFGAEELLEGWRKCGKSYQLYICEIELPGISGLELAKELRKRDGKALFVFLTRHLDYVMDVFEVITFDYVLKPITKEKLEAVLLKVIHYLGVKKQDFVFHFRKDHFRISCEDILYFEKNGRKAVIHTVNEEYKTNMTTAELWEQLDDKVFSHIHMSYIVNLGHIRAIEGDEVILDNSEHLLIARAHKQKFREKYIEFMQNVT